MPKTPSEIGLKYVSEKTGFWWRLYLDETWLALPHEASLCAQILSPRNRVPYMYPKIVTFLWVKLKFASNNKVNDSNYDCKSIKNDIEMRPVQAKSYIVGWKTVK